MLSSQSNLFGVEPNLSNLTNSYIPVCKIHNVYDYKLPPTHHCTVLDRKDAKAKPIKVAVS